MELYFPQNLLASELCLDEVDAKGQQPFSVFEIQAGWGAVLRIPLKSAHSPA